MTNFTAPNPPLPDAQLANDIRAAISHLNICIEAAVKAGLFVQIDSTRLEIFGARYSFAMHHAIVERRKEL